MWCSNFWHHRYNFLEEFLQKICEVSEDSQQSTPLLPEGTLLTPGNLWSPNSSITCPPGQRWVEPCTSQLKMLEQRATTRIVQIAMFQADCAIFDTKKWIFAECPKAIRDRFM